jgi:LacI family transcriptional regulator
LANGRNAPTIWDVAREAGVSKSSAARALAKRGSSSPALRQRVEEAAARLGYRPNALAKAIVSGSSATIGAIIPDVASPFFSATVRGLTDAARSAGFEVIVANTDNDPEIEARTIELLAEKRVDGIVIAPAFQDSPDALLRVLDDSIPVVILDRRSAALSQVPSVSLDSVGAARLGAEHLLSLGHRRIALVTEAKEDIDELLVRAETEDVTLWLPATQRLLGYLLAHREAGATPDPRLIIRCEYNASSAAAAVGRFLGSDTAVSAMFCSDAALTYGAYRELVDRNVLVPDDMSFVGFDDQDWTTLVKPAVTVVEQPRYRMGSSCTNMLLAQIRGLNTDNSEIRLPATLIKRASTAPVAPKSQVAAKLEAGL